MPEEEKIKEYAEQNSYKKKNEMYKFETTEFHQSVIGGMSSAQKSPLNWWNSECQKPLNVRLMKSCYSFLTGGF